MNLNVTKEWLGKRAGAEGDLEVCVGRRLTKTINLTGEEIADMQQLMFEALPRWAQDELTSLRAENARLWEVLKLSDAETRQWFIGDLIRKNGHLNRSDLVAAFNISVPQASVDIQKWIAANPGRISYNVHAKRYEKV
jgi:hypothetical protein